MAKPIPGVLVSLHTIYNTDLPKHYIQMEAGVTYHLEFCLIRHSHLCLTRLVLMCLHYLLIVGLHDAQCHHLLPQSIAFLLLLLLLLQQKLKHTIPMETTKFQCNTNISYIMDACFDWWAYTAEAYQLFLQEGYRQTEGFVVENGKDYIARP